MIANYQTIFYVCQKISGDSFATMIVKYVFYKNSLIDIRVE